MCCLFFPFDYISSTFVRFPCIIVLMVEIGIQISKNDPSFDSFGTIVTITCQVGSFELFYRMQSKKIAQLFAKSMNSVR